MVLDHGPINNPNDQLVDDEDRLTAADAEHQKRVSPEHEREIDQALGLERVSFAVPRELYEWFQQHSKEIGMVEPATYRAALEAYKKIIELARTLPPFDDISATISKANQ